MVMPGDRLRGHALLDGGQLVALLVLVEKGQAMRFAGFPFSDANELLAVDESAATALLRAAAEAHTLPLVLELLAPDGPTARLLRRADAGLEVRWTAAQPCPRLPAGAGPSNRLRKRFAAERRRAAVDLRCRQPDTADATDFVERRIALWAERGKRDGLRRAMEPFPALPEALGRACGELSRDGLCHIASLVVDGRCVAEDLYFGKRREPLLYTRRYEKNSSLSSPGMLLATAVRELPGVGEIDLGRGDESYKFRLGATADVRLTASVTRAGRHTRRSDGLLQPMP